MSEVAAARKPVGLPVLQQGFRPFFLLAALWAVVAVIVWLPQYFGELTLTNGFSPLDWHAHEALFGYGGAVVAGFLLTAVPNWTGRPPLRGLKLLALVALWLLGRVAVACSAQLSWALVAAIDLGFFVVLSAFVVREVVFAKNWRNLRVAAMIALFTLADLGFHLEAHFSGDASHGRRAAVAALIALILLIGGRIIPSFTENYLRQSQDQGRMPQKFSSFDARSMALSLFALAGFVVAPQNLVAGALLLAAGALNALRLARWSGERTSGEALVLILHLGYAFIPLGFILSGLSAFTVAVPLSAGLHALAAGGIGVMSLAVMTRASLGHSGRKLHAGRATQAIYAVAVVAALARIAAALAPSASFTLLHVAALSWSAAFLGFAVAYAPLFFRHRK